MFRLVVLSALCILIVASCQKKKKEPEAFACGIDRSFRPQNVGVDLNTREVENTVRLAVPLSRLLDVLSFVQRGVPIGDIPHPRAKELVREIRDNCDIFVGPDKKLSGTLFTRDMLIDDIPGRSCPLRADQKVVVYSNPNEPLPNLEYTLLLRYVDNYHQQYIAFKSGSWIGTGDPRVAENGSLQNVDTLIGSVDSTDLNGAEVDFIRNIKHQAGENGSCSLAIDSYEVRYNRLRADVIRETTLNDEQPVAERLFLNGKGVDPGWFGRVIERTLD